MGRHYVNKCVLLDEHEIEGLSGEEDFARIAETVEAECARLFCPDMDFPEYEYLGFVSERFDRSCLAEADYAEPCFLVSEAGWKANVAEICERTGLARDDLQSLEGVETRFEADIRAKLLRKVTEGDYAHARTLCDTLDGFQRTGLPGFRDSIHMTMGGEDDALDFRSRNRGSGRRIVAEFAFLWE